MQVTGLCLIAGGAAVFAFGWWRYSRAVAASAAAAGNWRRVVGTLHEATVQEDVTWDSQNDPVTEYAPAVRYGYTVDGRSFEGTRAFFSRTKFDNQTGAQNWLAARTPASEVAVWHDPVDPANSALEIDRPAKSGLIIAGIFAVILILVGAAL